MEDKNHYFKTALDHPALIDHFPGNPLVPGAMILDHVLFGCAIFAHDAMCALALKEIKFKSPLHGEEIAHVAYSESAQGIRFNVWVKEREIASGIIISQSAVKN